MKMDCSCQEAVVQYDCEPDVHIIELIINRHIKYSILRQYCASFLLIKHKSYIGKPLPHPCQGILASHVEALQKYNQQTTCLQLDRILLTQAAIQAVCKLMMVKTMCNQDPFIFVSHF